MLPVYQLSIPTPYPVGHRGALNRGGGIMNVNVQQ